MGLHETSRVRLSAPNGLVFGVEGGTLLQGPQVRADR